MLTTAILQIGQTQKTLFHHLQSKNCLMVLKFIIII